MYAQGFTADRRGTTVNLTFENASVQSAVGINHFPAMALWKRLGELLRQVDEAPSSPPSARPRPASMRAPETSGG